MENNYLPQYIKDILEILEAYETAFYLSKGQKLRISILQLSDGNYKFCVNKRDIGGSDSIMFTLKYHTNMKNKNIEVYHINHNVAIRINAVGDLIEFITINRQRAKQSRFAIEDAVIFIDGLKNLQKFLASIDKYF